MLSRFRLRSPVSVLAIAQVFAVVMALVVGPARADDEADRAARQARLDAACEAAREAKLAPIRKQIEAECLAEGQEESFCRPYAASYNGNRPNGSPLFYDLPACEAAFEHLQQGGR
jgi:hypothetical protein